MKNHVYIQNTFFCRSRTFDISKIKKYLLANNYKVVDSPNEAHYIILSTCGVANYATKKSIDEIIELKKYSAELIVVGCLPDTDRDLLNEIFDGKIIRNVEMNKLDLIFNPKVPFLSFENIAAEIHNDEFSLEVCRGCTEECSYCAVRKAIGSVKSLDLNSCKAQIENALRKNAKRIVLGAENVGAYGSDINTSLSELLEVVAYPHNSYILRINNLHPRYLIKFKDTIIKLVKQGVIGMLKIPIQSGSQKVLNMMKRYYDIDAVAEILKEIKSINKHVIILTDIIVSFPNENYDDLMLTSDFISDNNLDVGRIFQYTPKSNTEASQLDGHISQYDKDQSLKSLNMNLYKAGYVIKLDHNDNMFCKKIMYFDTVNPYTNEVVKLFL